MITLIIGKPDSGKSLMAEELLSKNPNRDHIYLATMKVCDEAGIKRIEKHRKQREGKGFTTLELCYEISKATSFIKDPQNSAVLLECISNLVGNEMYDNPERSFLVSGEKKDTDTFVKLISEDIKSLAQSVGNL
ncbi:MAG: bifunctional adenosylcobinamide kinase/adenosylcobinamide-phosphate guanylyltransferase, partial [Lachnospiraceae bacterium]|nr:bifunctional adenosylcobinamide kinase/adenosylcobinamide-phosphate guanylyltransferase [Lachnospiraceae bacterium]